MKVHPVGSMLWRNVYVSPMFPLPASSLLLLQLIGSNGTLFYPRLSGTNIRIAALKTFHYLDIATCVNPFILRIRVSQFVV